MFHHLNVQREATHVPWESIPYDYRPWWGMRWWARVVTVVLDGYDPWLAKRAKEQIHRQNYGALGDEFGPLTLEQHLRRLRGERYR